MPSKNAINITNHLVINGEDTYNWIARSIKRNGRCLVGWSEDGKESNDILFTFDRQGIVRIGRANPGVNPKNLFVSVLGRGSFTVEMNNLVTSPSFIGNSMSVPSNSFADKIAQLVAEVKVRL